VWWWALIWPAVYDRDKLAVYGMRGALLGGGDRLFTIKVKREDRLWAVRALAGDPSLAI
jgi:hypothetical protein